MMLYFRRAFLTGVLGAMAISCRAGSSWQTGSQQVSTESQAATVETSTTAQAAPETASSTASAAPDHVSLDDVGATYVLRQRESWLRVSGQAGADGAADGSGGVWALRPATGLASEQFRLVAGPGKTYAIAGLDANACLDAGSGGSAVGKSACGTGSSQKWYLVPQHAGLALASVASPQECLGTQPGAAGDPQQLVLATCDQSAQQTFDLIKTGQPLAANPATYDGHQYQDLSNQTTLPFGAAAFAATYNTDPTQVSQGAEGNCGALAGLLAVAAAQPNMLIDHVHHLGIDTSNTDLYAIDLFSGGAWKAIAVSASTPAQQASSHLGPLVYWGPLYEKALAVVKGGYPPLGGINTTEVIQLITGQTTPQVVGGGSQALQAVEGGLSVTGVGVTTGWQDDATGAPLTAWKPGALYVRDQHYYAIGGFVDASRQRVVLINPWNQGAGDKGNFSISSTGFVNLFWGYAISQKNTAAGP